MSYPAPIYSCCCASHWHDVEFFFFGTVGELRSVLGSWDPIDERGEVVVMLEPSDLLSLHFYAFLKAATLHFRYDNMQAAHLGTTETAAGATGGAWATRLAGISLASPPMPVVSTARVSFAQSDFIHNATPSSQATVSHSKAAYHLHAAGLSANATVSVATDPFPGPIALFGETWIELRHYAELRGRLRPTVGVRLDPGAGWGHDSSGGGGSTADRPFTWQQLLLEASTARNAPMLCGTFPGDETMARRATIGNVPLQGAVGGLVRHWPDRTTLHAERPPLPDAGSLRQFDAFGRMVYDPHAPPPTDGGARVGATVAWELSDRTASPGAFSACFETPASQSPFVVESRLAFRAVASCLHRAARDEAFASTHKQPELPEEFNEPHAATKYQN